MGRKRWTPSSSCAPSTALKGVWVKFCFKLTSASVHRSPIAYYQTVPAARFRQVKIHFFNPYHSQQQIFLKLDHFLLAQFCESHAAPNTETRVKPKEIE